MDLDVFSEEIEIKTEYLSSGDDDNTVDMVSSSFPPAETEAQPAQTFQRIFCRQSLDSNLSDQLSICSPSTSNQPMFSSLMSPIEMPDSTPMFRSPTMSPIESSPESSPDRNSKAIKEEPHGMTFDEMILNQNEEDNCVVKMEVPMDNNNSCDLLVTTETNSNSVPWNEPLKPLKRQLSSTSTTQNERAKRQKTSDEVQLNGNSYVKTCFFQQIFVHYLHMHSSSSYHYPHTIT